MFVDWKYMKIAIGRRFDVNDRLSYEIWLVLGKEYPVPEGFRRKFTFMLWLAWRWLPVVRRETYWGVLNGIDSWAWTGRRAIVGWSWPLSAEVSLGRP